jgi:hypothetical protein
MKRYVWRNGQFVDRTTGEPMEKPYAGQVCAPMVMPDIPEYRSPINGALISSRSTQREDLKRNDCYLAEPKRRGFKNPRFAKKHGLPLREDVRDATGR